MPVTQTCAISKATSGPYKHGHIMRVTWDWTSATGGAVVAAGAAGVGTTTDFRLSGYVASFHTKPGSPAPTAYNITLYDDWGRPLATKTGASTTTAENHTAGLYLVNNTLNIVISSAGDGKAGTAIADILLD